MKKIMNPRSKMRKRLRRKPKRIRPKLNEILFIKEAKMLHGKKYSYAKTKFTCQKNKVIITCNIHGDFLQTAECHLRGHGCAKCGNQKTISHTKNNSKTFIAAANKIHRSKYSYSLVIYKNNSTKVDIICKIHGSFLQTPASHLRGSGCPLCHTLTRNSDKLLTIEEFIKRSSTIHNNKYDYNQSFYVNEDTLVIIMCHLHGTFHQTPRVHLRGSGCPKCATISKISKLEIMWLDKLGIPNDPEHRQRKIIIDNRRFKVDGFDPITNTIYEFYGDYWHGNINNPRYKPDDYNKISNKKFKILYKETIEKENYFINHGYKIVSIWESDFKRKYK